jgi:hypothetical protein
VLLIQVRIEQGESKGENVKCQDSQLRDPPLLHPNPPIVLQIEGHSIQPVDPLHRSIELTTLSAPQVELYAQFWRSSPDERDRLDGSTGDCETFLLSYTPLFDISLTVC